MKAFEIIRQELECYDLDEVAELAGVHPTAIRNWVNEHNYPRLENFIKVAEVIGYKVDVTVTKS